MNRIYSILITLFFLSNVLAQSEKREIENFQTLEVSNALQVVLTQGSTNEIFIESDNLEDFEKIKTEIINGKLSVFSKGRIKSKSNVRVLITFTEMNKIIQSGASEIRSTNTIKGDKFMIDGSGAIGADLTFDVKNLSVDFSGASNVKISGIADNFNLKLSGASDLKASDLKAKNVVVDISGASDVKVFASESISGKAAGASTIHVKGSPKIREITTSVASDTSYSGVLSDIEDEDILSADSTTEIDKRGTRIYLFNDSIVAKKKRKKRRNHWAGVDLGINGFLDANHSFDLSNPSHFNQSNPQKVTQFMELNYSKSWTFSINFMEYFIKIKDHHFGIVTGLGTEWNNYELKHNIKLNSKGGSYVFPTVDEFNEDYTWGEIDTVYSYSKNRFKTWFLNAPLLLELNTGNNKNKSFHISAGAIFGLNLQTKMKYKYDELDGSEKKEKDKQSFNTNPFRVSLTTRVGVGRFNVFATYSLTPLFENGRGPELYPFTIGVTLLGF